MDNLALLNTINAPDDLRKLQQNQLPKLASELREFLLNAANESGGHLGAGLGAVELTIALHYVFNTPYDQIVFDVGHQAYPHKALTGRKDLLHTIRKKDGLAPFPRREESIYDAFGVGHSSTSISAAIGMSLAQKTINPDDPKQAIAVIGDGGMTAGLAFEALNHAGDAKADVLVILNDNEMSISGNVGALSNYLTKILSSKLYSHLRTGSHKVLDKIPEVSKLAKRTESKLKSLIVPGTFFEELGFRYFGPIDGHDTEVLIKTLTNLKTIKGPKLLHVITKKGKGFLPAEQDPIKYHGVSKGFYNPEPKPAISNNTVKNPTYSEIFGDWLCEMAQKEPKLVGITPAMREGSGMVKFAQDFPNQYIDVAIAEQHSVALAAGLACENMKPVVAIYSSFLQRAYDQLIHDVALQNLPVLFAIDRAGLVGDGPTHAGIFDLSFLRCIPNMIVMAPSDGAECRKMLYTGLKACQPAAVRYPRGSGPLVDLTQELTALPIGKANIIRTGSKVAILSFGAMLKSSLKVASKLNATCVDMRFVKPLDEALITELSKSHDLFVTIEENVIQGGAGSGVNEYLFQNNIQISVLNLGLPDYFVEHGEPDLMMATCDLDEAGILSSIQSKLDQMNQVSINTCNNLDPCVK